MAGSVCSCGRTRYLMNKDQLEFREYNGVQTYVGYGGDFIATVDGVLLREKTYEGLINRIENERKVAAKSMSVSLPCYALVRSKSNQRYDVRSLTLIGLNRNDSSWRFGEGEDPDTVIIHLSPATEKNQQLLGELKRGLMIVEAAEALLKTRTIPNGRYGRIEASKYSELLEALTHWYRQAFDPSKEVLP